MDACKDAVDTAIDTRAAVELLRAGNGHDPHKKLEQIADRQREFVSTASHELRTPLTTIMGYLELVLDLSSTLGEDDREHLLVALNASHRLSSLVDDLMTTHRMGSEGLLVQAAPIVLLEALEPTLAAYTASCERSDIELNREWDDNRGEVMADRAATASIMNHLMSNALKFTAAGGSITLRTLVTDCTTDLVISDSGMGIAEDEIEHIFEPFFRSSSAIKEAISGTGLGLAITKALVDAQDGVIAVDSEPGVGTTVTVSFVTVARPGSTTAEGVDDEQDPCG